MSPSGIIHSYGDVTIAGEGLQNLGLCLVLGAFSGGFKRDAPGAP
jgi:hypothetical protein